MGNRALCGGSMCPKATLQPGGDHELLDDGSACDPAGTVFNETLEDLNEMDRLLLLFSSSSNLAAVRWLFVMGACADACDTSGTTCLHAACRSGSQAIVREYIRRDLPLDALDVAGWTPIHVALFMGRRSVALLLMRSGADLAQRNSQGLAPADLCSDVWLREAIQSCAIHRHVHGLDRPWEFGHDGDIYEDIQISSRLRFEPFFVPRSAVLKDAVNVTALQEFGIEIFNQRPGQGLAFLVSSGAVRDFPVELSTFLSEHTVSLTQVGEFLGEDFSLSQTLRLEYINSVRLVGTGAVSCLARVFERFRLPADMQKIDRLVDGIAQIWWRQHEQLREKADRDPLTGTTGAAEAAERPAHDSGEIEGLRLMRQLKSHDALHQLMFSAIMLHWNLYSDLPQSQRLTPERWVELNADLVDAGAEEASSVNSAATRHIQCLVYNTVSHTFFPQLQVYPPRSLRAGLPADAVLTAKASGGREGQPANHKGAAAEAEGWAMLVDGCFPSVAGSTGTIAYRHIRSILSETTSTALALASPSVSRQEPPQPLSAAGALPTPAPSTALPTAPEAPGRAPPPQGPPGGAAVATRHPVMGGDVLPQTGRSDWVWLSLKRGLLFLAPKPHTWAPYAYVHLHSGLVEAADRAGLTVTLTAAAVAAASAPSAAFGAPGLQASGPAGGPCDGEPWLAGGGGGSSPSSAPRTAAPPPPLQLVFLLPDGRWQVLEIARLKVQVPDAHGLEQWLRGFALYCGQQGKAPRGAGAASAAGGPREAGPGAACGARRSDPRAALAEADL